MRRVVLATALCLFVLTGPAQAKVVGIVFDDSGSMAGSFQTALYTLQVMLASLPPEDRVFMVKMSNPEAALSIDIAGERQRLLSSVRQWPVPEGWTPYLAVQTALDTMQREIRPGEKGMILVITDGEFLQNPVDDRYTVNRINKTNIVAAKPCTDSLPCAADLKSRYLAFKQQAGEGVEAFFVTLASNPAKAADLRRTVEMQGVRPTLLEVFNGSRTNGAFEVAERRQIYTTFTQIASRLLESDAGDSNAANWNSNGLEFQSPLPIKRLTLIRTGTPGAIPPAIATTSFSGSSQEEQLRVGMNKPDAVSDEALEGRVDNLVFKTPLEADSRHQVTFAGAQPERGILILTVDATILAQISDAAGQSLQPGTDGVYQVDAGQTVQFSAWLETGLDKKRVDLCKLGGVEFKIHSAFHPAPIAMELGCEAATRAVTFDTAARGVGTIAISAALKDYLNARASDFILNVREIKKVDLGLQALPGPDCPDCRAESIALPYKDEPGEEAMLQIKPIAKDSMETLEYELAGDLPPGVRLVTSSGTAIPAGQRVPVSARESINVVYTSDYAADEDSVFTLAAHAIRPWSGTASIELTARPINVPVEIKFLGTSLSTQAGESVEFPLDALQQKPYLLFELQGLRSSDAINPEHIRLGSSTGRLRLNIEPVEEKRFKVGLGLWYCDCFTSTGKIDLNLQYNNPKTRQHATADMGMVISAGSWLSRCWQELLALLLLVLLLLKILCLLRTSRFHKKLYIAEYLVTQHGARIEQDGVRAHSWVALIWPVCKDEQRLCYGEFLFQAQPRKDRVYLVNQGGFARGLTLDDEPLEDMKDKALIVFRSGQVLRRKSADGMTLEYELQIVE